MNPTEAQRAQQIVDHVMREMAIRHGSSTRRDFEVANLVLEKQAERASPSGLAALREALQAIVEYETVPYIDLPPEKRNRDIRDLLAAAEDALLKSAEGKDGQ